MKTKINFILILLALVILPTVVAANCQIDASLINQDPYPAIPGEYVKVVFQIEGVENPECGVVEFELKESYPISLDPNTTSKITINSGTYSRKYSSFYLATYKLRIDEDALDGNNPIEVAYSGGSNAEILKEFNIFVEDTKADFEVYVKNYDYITRILTFEILNIEDVDVEAVTLEIPKQENTTIKGANKKVVGDLDSNEYTTADFEATPKDGEIEVVITYTDSINVRRTITKQVEFDSSYFTDRAANQKSQPIWLYAVIGLIIVWFIWRRIRKAKREREKEKEK